MRFNLQAQRILVLTRQEAECFQHNYIGTEHLLIAMLQDDGPIGNLLRLYLVELPRVRDMAQHVYLAQNYPPNAEQELALDLRIMLSAAAYEVHVMRRPTIGADVLFLTLMSQPSCHAVDILQALNIRADSLRQEFQTARGGGPPALRKYQFGPRQRPSRMLPSEMPEQLSPNAKRALALAKEEARFYRHSVINSAHLLVGLMETEGQAQRVLAYLGLDSTRLRAVMQNLYMMDQSGDSLALSPDLEEVLVLASGEGRPGENAIGTGHLLLGITLQSKSIALDILKKFNISASRIQRLIIRKLIVE